MLTSVMYQANMGDNLISQVLTS